MADILIRDLDPALKSELSARAKSNGRSQQAEALAILEAGLASRKDPWFARLQRAAQRVGGIELPQPERHAARETSTESWA